MENKCVLCGAIIPEGRQVCPTCQHAVHNNPYCECCHDGSAYEGIHMTNKDFIQMMGGHIDDSMVRWLDDIGFFTAPASVSHHGNQKGGLFLHSMEVMRQLLWLTEELDLQW